MFIQSCMVSS